MRKNTELEFVGLPIFKQLVDLINAVKIESLVGKLKYLVVKSNFDLKHS